LAPPQPPAVWSADQPVDTRPGRPGLLRQGLDAVAVHRRGRPPSPQAAGHPLAPCQALDHLARPGLRAKKNARDRLIRLAQRHPEWVLGYQDETWWSRLAQPALHAWTADAPLHLVEQPADKSDPDPKALACYGLLRDDTGAMLLRFVEGRPVSQVTEDFLA